MSDRITPHFSWAEVIRSETAARLGIDNRLPKEFVPNVQRMAEALEEARAVLGVPMRVTSWYRCPALNAAVGGSVNSAHMRGLAVDFQPVGMELEEAFWRLSRSPLPFDQLIIESTADGARWIHYGLREGKPRRQVWRARGKQRAGEMVFERVHPG